MSSQDSPDRYPSNLTDAEWKQIKSIFDRFQFVEHDPRTILNGILYVLKGGILKGGIQWRMLPAEFPPWQTVYSHFRQRRMLNLFQKLYFKSFVTGSGEQPAWPRDENRVQVRQLSIPSQFQPSDRAGRDAALTRTSRSKGENDT